MANIDRGINEAEKIFRGTIEREMPLFKNIEVNRKWKKPFPGMYWMFSIGKKKPTDEKNLINAWVFNPKALDKAFKDVVNLYNNKKLMGTGEIERLYSLKGRKIDKEHYKENLMLMVPTYLFFHEINHKDIPFGREDEKKIDKALYEAIREICPNESRATTVLKVSGCRNMVWDFGDDTAFFKEWKYDSLGDTLRDEIKNYGVALDGTKVDDLPDGTIPVWDVIELHRSDQPLSKTRGDATASWAMSRIMYSMLFADTDTLRGNLFKMFYDAMLKSPEARRKGIRKDGVRKRVKDAFKNMARIQKKDVIDVLNVDGSEFDVKKYCAAVDDMYDNMMDKAYVKDRDYVLKCITTLISDDKSRYESLKGFIKPFADILSAQMSSARGEGEIGSGSVSSALENLLEELDQGEAEQLLQDVMNEMGDENPYQPGTGRGRGRGGDSPRHGLDMIAMDEYYKKNRYKIDVKNPSYKDEVVDAGVEQEWVLKRSSKITDEQRLRYMNKIERHQRTVGPKHPVLIERGKGIWTLNEYEVKETQLITTRTVSTGIEVPKNIIFIPDCSGSMFTGIGWGHGSGNYAGSGLPYDELNKVIYGVTEALVNAASKMKQKVHGAAAPFSNSTRWSGFHDLAESYKTADNPFKQMLHTPEEGGTYLDATVFDRAEKEKEKGKTAYIIITDGQLDGGDSVLQKMKQYSKNKDNAFIYIEIGGSSDFGGEVKKFAKRHNNVSHYIENISTLGKRLESILIKYG
ncbi:MAG: hypothetical protein ACE5J7_03020 [Candidatus Aenigmatarchaeota archaeon]